MRPVNEARQAQREEVRQHNKKGTPMITGDDTGLMQVNQKGWNKLAEANKTSTYYNLDTFRAGRSSLRSLEKQTVGDVAGLQMLHLQCHLGLNAISWARLGANVTAVDFADSALEVARGLARDLNVDNIRFVASNVFDLPKNLDAAGQFDVAYTDYGVLSWLPDLSEWARVIAHFLKPGGIFHLVEIHPLLDAYAEVDGEMRPQPYLFTKGPTSLELATTYGDGFEGAPEVDTLTEFSWPWTIASVVNALIGAGLRIEALNEVPVDCRQRFSAMVPDPDEEFCWRLPGDPLPLSFTCSARKPAGTGE
jgi:2-polyprenyl-3-methyl-5-hydroxy-6-metoxy-1,4-benzoquinol methylase